MLDLNRQQFRPDRRIEYGPILFRPMREGLDATNIVKRQLDRFLSFARVLVERTLCAPTVSRMSFRSRHKLLLTTLVYLQSPAEDNAPSLPLRPATADRT